MYDINYKIASVAVEPCTRSNACCSILSSAFCLPHSAIFLLSSSIFLLHFYLLSAFFYLPAVFYLSSVFCILLPSFFFSFLPSSLLYSDFFYLSSVFFFSPASPPSHSVAVTGRKTGARSSSVCRLFRFSTVQL